MNNSYWIKKENVSRELIETLIELGYKKCQDYFSENNSDILMTTCSSKNYMYANHEYAHMGGNPHQSWLICRDYCKTSEELIKKLTDERF